MRYITSSYYKRAVCSTIRSLSIHLYTSGPTGPMPYTFSGVRHGRWTPAHHHPHSHLITPTSLKCHLLDYDPHWQPMTNSLGQVQILSLPLGRIVQHKAPHAAQTFASADSIKRNLVYLIKARHRFSLDAPRRRRALRALRRVDEALGRGGIRQRLCRAGRRRRVMGRRVRRPAPIGARLDAVE